VAEFDIIFGEGISSEGNLIDVASDLGIIKRAGTWFSYAEHRLGQGRDKAREFLKENPAIAKEIDLGVRALLAEQKLAAATGNTPVAAPAVLPDALEPELPDMAMV
jgi:recombination protein RecA